MAIIDYHSVKSLIFANLIPSSRILIPVLSCLCDDWDGSLSPEHSKHQTLAMYSGLSVASVKRSLKELREKSIISIVTQSGRPASIQYIPQTKLSAKGSSQIPTSRQKVAHGDLPRSVPESPQTHATPEPKQSGKLLALNDSPQDKEQQPEIPVLADRVGHTLVKRMIAEKGEAFVVDCLLAMSGRNGEIQDYPAYFVSCCSRDVIPWSHAQKAEALATAKRRKAEKRQQGATVEWERKKKEVLREQDDPEVQARVSKLCGDFLSGLGIDDHRPPA